LTSAIVTLSLLSSSALSRETMTEVMANDAVQPTTLPEKRCLESADDEVSRKAAKVDLLQDGRMPARPLPKSTTVTEEQIASAVSAAVLPEPDKCQIDCGQEPPSLAKAQEEARRLFRDIYLAFALERDTAKGDEVTRSDAASKLAEDMATERYEELRSALLGLRPWLGASKPAVPTPSGRDYDVIEFEGIEPPKHLTAPNMKDKKGKEVGADILQKAQLEWFRPKGEREQAWESLTELLSTISSRSEMNWLEGITIANEIDYKAKKQPGCKKRGTEKRKEWVTQYILKQEQYGCGNFVGHLMHHGTLMRVSLVPGIPKPIPATVVITCRETLWDALLREDDEGPIRFPPVHPDTNKLWTPQQKKKWLMQPGRQFAFQLANLDGDEEDQHDCREPGRLLKPDAKLRDLLRGKQTAIHLEVIAALAPRDIMKKEGLSEIVKAELAMVTRSAKERGEPVIFCLGSTNPHVLAKKVYLRPPIADHGLKCGYIRWRNSPDEPWARERSWDMRMCFCLQMP